MPEPDNSYPAVRQRLLDDLYTYLDVMEQKVYKLNKLAESIAELSDEPTYEGWRFLEQFTTELKMIKDKK